MPNLNQDSPPKPEPHRIYPLAGLTVLVILAHWALLTSAPLASASPVEPQATSSLMFTTRMIHAEPLVRKVSQDSTEPVRQTQITPRAQRPDPATAKPIQPPPNLDLTPTLATSNATEVSDNSNNSDNSQTATDSGENLTELPDASSETLAANTPLIERPISSTSDEIAPHYSVPESTRLKYDIKGEVKGFPYFANGDLLWKQDGEQYQARLEISHFLLGSRVQTSKGQLTQQGLEPLRFGDKVRSEVAAHFERSKNKVSFSANTPDVPLQPGAQDQLSVFIQLASLLRGNPTRYPQGSQIAFQAIGSRSAESWIFTVGTTEAQVLPGGTVEAIKLTREPIGEFDPRVEVWLAPSIDFLPVRIRLTQGNKDFVEQLWRSTQKP
jgi:hypothetical protein